MESKKGLEEKGRILLAEWEKPSVKELDINTMTLSGGTTLIFDGDGYS
jgi:hypothetical protein